MQNARLPLALSPAAGSGLLWRAAGPQGHGCVWGNSWQWTQLPDCKSSTIVLPIEFQCVCAIKPQRKCATTKRGGKKRWLFDAVFFFWWNLFIGSKSIQSCGRK